MPRCSLQARGGSSPCSPCSRPKPGAARGSAWLRSRRQAAPPLPSAARRGALNRSGRGASRHSTHGLRPGSNKGLDKQERRLAREKRPSIRSRQLRIGASRAIPCRNPEQVPPACLDDKPSMARHRLPGTGVLPQRNSSKAQAGSDDCQDQAANGSVPDMKPSLPGQHSSL